MLCAHAKFAGMEVSTFDNNQQTGEFFESIPRLRAWSRLGKSLNNISLDKSRQSWPVLVLVKLIWNESITLEMLSSR
jgi:hypothetical protein